MHFFTFIIVNFLYNVMVNAQCKVCFVLFVNQKLLFKFI